MPMTDYQFQLLFVFFAIAIIIKVVYDMYKGNFPFNNWTADERANQRTND